MATCEFNKQVYADVNVFPFGLVGYGEHKIAMGSLQCAYLEDHKRTNILEILSKSENELGVNSFSLLLV